MSIATDEAEQWAQSRYVGSSHIERYDGRAVSVPNYPQKTNLRREGYIAGRTAEPTDAFVNAENGKYGLDAVEAGIKALNAKREES